MIFKFKPLIKGLDSEIQTQTINPHALLSECEDLY
jgi:hypothetical protein